MYCGNAIWPHNEEGLENLARYIIRASFSQERMTYIAADESTGGVAKVIYDSKDGKTSKAFDAPDWLAQLVTHIPNKGEWFNYESYFMGREIGASLAEEIFKYCKTQEIENVYTSVRWNSTDLLSFFKTLGFDRSNFINLRKVIE